MYRNIEYILGLREEPDVVFGMLMGSGNHAKSKNGHGDHKSSGAPFKQVQFRVPHRVASSVSYEPVFSQTFLSHPAISRCAR